MQAQSRRDIAFYFNGREVLSIRDFNEIIAMAAARKGGLPALGDTLATTPVSSPSIVTAISDDRILAEMIRWVFYAGFSSRVVDSKWPAFEVAFKRFDPHCNALIDENRYGVLIRDRNIIRNGAKIRAIQINAKLVLDLAAASGSAARFLAQWPDDDYVGLLKILQKNGSYLSGQAAMRFLRAIGKPAFITTDEVISALIRDGVIVRRPKKHEDLAVIQAAFNAWSEQSGRNLTEMSRILAMSVGNM